MPFPFVVLIGYFVGAILAILAIKKTKDNKDLDDTEMTVAIAWPIIPISVCAAGVLLAYKAVVHQSV